MNLLNVLTLITFAMAVFALIYILVRRHEISRFINVNRLGVVEQRIHGLKHVIVLAHNVEKPNSKLSDAVEANMAKGKEYLFVLSMSNAEKELEGYYLIFEAYARIAAQKSNKNISARDLVKIKTLPFDWSDVPHIFYLYQEDGADHTSAIAYRGNRKRRGIADYYEKLSESRSESVVLTLLGSVQEMEDVKVTDKYKLDKKQGKAVELIK